MKKSLVNLAVIASLFTSVNVIAASVQTPVTATVLNACAMSILSGDLLFKKVTLGTTSTSGTWNINVQCTAGAQPTITISSANNFLMKGKAGNTDTVPYTVNLLSSNTTFKPGTGKETFIYVTAATGNKDELQLQASANFGYKLAADTYSDQVTATSSF